MFQHLLREEAVGLRLEAPNREAALAELIALLPSQFLPSRKKADLLDLLLQRERFGTTATGEGVALPHCIFSEASIPIASLGISRKGIAYPSLDGTPVHIIFLVVFPEKSDLDADRYRILREAETFFRDRFLMERLKISETPEEVCEIIFREANHQFDSSQNLRAIGGN